MEENKYYEYDVKCRKCGKIERMCFGQIENTKPEDFKRWAAEHSTFPIQKQCRCDNGMMMFHDIVSFGNVLIII
tara:strand:- start:53 stop:274 length:222 start_codon:yes stop_codon:yes gene_type:complete